MQATNSSTTLAQPFLPVKSTINTQLPLFPDSMIHHNAPPPRSKIVLYYKGRRIGDGYGVSRTYRVLSPQLLYKRFDQVRDCLANVVGLSVSQREVVLRLLRYWAYYGQVYTKEKTVTELPGCSKATYWRTIGLLRGLGLIQVVNRYVIRPKAQISNLYRFDRLLILLARYLAEHGVAFLERWLTPILAVPGQQFWAAILPGPEARAGPGVVEFSSS